MRHDPAGASIIIMLRSLKLHGMAHAVDDLVTQGVPAFEAATPMLSQLLKAEMAEREVRSIAYHTKVARLTDVRTSRVLTSRRATSMRPRSGNSIAVSS